MTRKLVLTGVPLLALLFVAPANVGAQNRPCADDARKFCPDVTPGKGGVLNCLKPHRDELSDACKQQLQQVEKRQQSMSEHREKARTARAHAHWAPVAPAPTP